MAADLMKKYFGFAMVFVCLLLAPGGQTAPAPATPATKKAAVKTPSDAGSAVAEPQIPLSVFVVPKDPTQGKDPFFPASSRPYGPGKQMQTNKTAVVEVTLILNGFIPPNLVMVNGRTFAEGEEGDVVVSGVRKRIRCIKIKEDSALIELLPEGQRQELRLRTRLDCMEDRWILQIKDCKRPKIPQS